jgi:hypothetical protein
MVVFHVFDFDLNDAGAGSLVSSTTPPRACRRNGFQCELAAEPIVGVALQSVAPVRLQDLGSNTRRMVRNVRTHYFWMACLRRSKSEC